MELLEQRVGKLEHELRCWRACALATAVGVTVWISLAAQAKPEVPDVLRAKRIETEHVSVMLDGKERVALGVDDQGPDNRIPGVFLYRAHDKSNDDCARFVVFGQNDEPELVFKNRDHKVQLWLASKEESARLSLHDKQGVQVEGLSSTHSGLSGGSK